MLKWLYRLLSDVLGLPAEPEYREFPTREPRPRLHLPKRLRSEELAALSNHGKREPKP